MSIALIHNQSGVCAIDIGQNTFHWQHNMNGEITFSSTDNELKSDGDH